MRTISTVLSIAIAVILGCGAANQRATADEKEREGMARVTGIGGVFFLSRSDGKALRSWYEKHLGMRMEDYGFAILEWKNDTAEDKGATVWRVADRDSDWFSPSESKFMINYRVDDMEAMVKQLTAAGIDILQGPEYHENGVFAWIMDPEGNKIELWEPKIWDDKNKK
jgi:predicted enzyme related to lactoylglutathione lyase